jgi:hypothetical protein
MEGVQKQWHGREGATGATQLACSVASSCTARTPTMLRKTCAGMRQSTTTPGVEVQSADAPTSAAAAARRAAAPRPSGGRVRLSARAAAHAWWMKGRFLAFGVA